LNTPLGMSPQFCVARDGLELVKRSAL